MPTPSGANQDSTASAGRRSAALPPVRSATPTDAERLALINMVTWQQSYAGLVPDTYLETFEVERLRDRWATRIAEPGDRVTLVAEVDGVVAAYSVVGGYRTQHDAEPEDTTGWGELYAIYTHPEMQGRGAGLAVHNASLVVLSRRGFGVAALWVLRDNARTRRWYGDRGWRTDGATSQWLGSGVPLEEVRMTRSTHQGAGPASGAAQPT